MDILDKYAKVMNDRYNIMDGHLFKWWNNRDILNEYIIEILDEIFKGMIKVFWVKYSMEW